MPQKAAEHRSIVPCSKDPWHVVFMKRDLFRAAPFCCDLKTYLMADSLHSRELCFHEACRRAKQMTWFPGIICRCSVVALHAFIDGCCLIVFCSDVPEVSLQAQWSGQSPGMQHWTADSRPFNHFCSHVYQHPAVLDQLCSYASLRTDHPQTCTELNPPLLLSPASRYLASGTENSLFQLSSMLLSSNSSEIAL